MVPIIIRRTKAVAICGAGSARAINATAPRNQSTTLCHDVSVPATTLAVLFTIVELGAVDGGGSSPAPKTAPSSTIVNKTASVVAGKKTRSQKKERWGRGGGVLGVLS